MTIRHPKKLKIRAHDPWWSATHLSPPEINDTGAPAPAAPTGELTDHPLIEAVLTRFPGAQIVKTRPGGDPNVVTLSDVVYRWRDAIFQDARDCAEIDRLRLLYSRFRWWRTGAATPFRPGAGVLRPVGDYVEKTERFRAQPQADTVALLSMDLKGEKAAMRAKAREAKKAAKAMTG